MSATQNGNRGDLSGQMNSLHATTRALAWNDLCEQTGKTEQSPSDLAVDLALARAQVHALELHGHKIGW